MSQEDKAIDVSFLESCPRNPTDCPPQTVLLLHDRYCTSKVWDEVGSLTLLSAMGYRAVAFDIPRYGDSSDVEVCDKSQFLQSFMDGADIVAPIIVVADIGGQYVIPYLLQHSGRTLPDKVRGCVAVAPTNTEQVLCDERSRHVHVPVLSIYGDDDHSGSPARNMHAMFPHHTLLQVQGCGLRYYVNETDDFHYLLYNALIQIDKHQTYIESTRRSSTHS